MIHTGPQVVYNTPVTIAKKAKKIENSFEIRKTRQDARRVGEGNRKLEKVTPGELADPLVGVTNSTENVAKPRKSE